MTTTVNHWIDNKEFVSTSGRTAPVYDPALGVETKRVALANGAEINAAIAAAKKAFPGWSKTSLAARQQVIFKFRELLNTKRVNSQKSSPANTAKFYQMPLVKSHVVKK